MNWCYLGVWRLPSCQKIIKTKISTLRGMFSTWLLDKDKNKNGSNQTAIVCERSYRTIFCLCILTKLTNDWIYGISFQLCDVDNRQVIEKDIDLQIIFPGSINNMNKLICVLYHHSTWQRSAFVLPMAIPTHSNKYDELNAIYCEKNLHMAPSTLVYIAVCSMHHYVLPHGGLAYNKDSGPKVIYWTSTSHKTGDKKWMVQLQHRYIRIWHQLTSRNLVPVILIWAMTNSLIWNNNTPADILPTGADN